MKKPGQISRRGLGLLLASTASPLSARSMQAAQAPAQANDPPESDLNEARKRVQQQAEALNKVKVAADIEPAFRFVP